MKKIALLGSFMFMVLILSNTPVLAADKNEEKSIAAKAAEELIKSMPDIFKDVVAMQNMTDDQKVNYVLTQAEKRIKDKIADKFQNDMKDLLTDYTKKSLRAKAFMDIAVPQIRHAVSMGQEFNWASLDARVKEQADNNFKAIMQAIGAAKFSYSVYQTASEKGALEAFKQVSAKLYDALANAYIPGWGYFKVGVSIVEGLGNFILNYTMEESVDGMLESMYSFHSNPQGLAQWLYDKSPSAIDKDIDEKWEQLSATFRFPGALGEEGPKKARQMIKSALMDMRMQIVLKVKAEERKQEELKHQAEQELKPAQEAQKKIEELGARVKKEAEEPLSKIHNFKEKFFKYKEEDAQRQIADAQEAFEKEVAEAARAAMKYQPIDKSTIVAALERALEEIKDSGIDGFNREKLEYDYKEYQKIRADLIADSNKKIAQQVELAAKILKQIDDEYRPQINAATARYQNARNDGERNSALAELQSLQNAYSNAVQPYLNIQYILTDQQVLDLQVLVAEEQKVLFEAQGRAAKMTETLTAGIERLKTASEKAAKEFNENKAILDQEIAAKLKYPDALSRPDYYDNILKQAIYISRPSDLAKQLQYFEEVRNNLENDQRYIPELKTKEKELYAKYITAEKEVVNDFKKLVPPVLVPQEVGGRIKEGKDTGHETIEYVLQPPWGFFTPIGQVIPDMRENAIAIYRLWYPYRSFDEQLKEINKPLLNDISKALSEAKKRVEEWQNLAYLGQLASFYANIVVTITSDPVSLKIIDTSLEQEKRRVADLFPYESGGAIMRVLPEESEGATYLKQLKVFWEKNKVLVEKLKNLRQQIGDGLEQYFHLSKDSYPLIEKLETTPDRIRLYEAGLEQAKKDYDNRVRAGERYLNEERQKFNQIQTGQMFSYEEKLRQLKKGRDTAAHYLDLEKGWKANADLQKLIQGWETLVKDLDSEIKKTEGQKEISDANQEREYEAREKARQEQGEEARKKEEEQRRQLEEAREGAKNSAGGMASFYGYSVLNPRLNTFSLNMASGDVILTRTDLKLGALEITGRLSNMDKVGTILFSEDAGRTWKEIGRLQDISYSFIPLPDKLYQPLLRIKTTDSQDVDVKIFPSSVNGIIFKDVEYDKLVAETIQKIAEAYEAQNLSIFSQYISRDYLGNKTFLEEGVRLDFDLFTNIRLTIYINRIDKRSGLFAAETRWDKTQTPRKTGQEQRTSGNTTFMFAFEDGRMKIKNLRGNLIYATLQPEIAQASGLSQTVVDQIRQANQERNPVQPGAGETEQSGGTSTSQVESGTFSITQSDSHAAVGWIQEFDFSAKQTYTVDVLGPTYDFRRREGWLEVKTGVGIQDLGAVSIDSVTEAPASGYNTIDTPTLAHTYALQLSDGTFALVYINTLPGIPPYPGTSTFSYKHQKDGTRSFK
jgi:hypothetical protein